MNCTQCGAELQPGVAFCNNCGAAVSGQQQINTAKDPGEEQGLISMILGIVALGTTLLAGGGGIGLICAVIGLILGITSEKASAAVGISNQRAKIGKYCSIASLALWVLYLVLAVVIVALYFIFVLGIFSMAY